MNTEGGENCPMSKSVLEPYLRPARSLGLPVPIFLLALKYHCIPLFCRGLYSLKPIIKYPSLPQVIRQRFSHILMVLKLFMITVGEKWMGQGIVLKSDQESELVMTHESITRL